MTSNKLLYAVLIGMGVVWGGVFTLNKIAVSTGYQPFGILLWQMVIGLLMSVVVLAVRGKLNCISRPALLLFSGIAVLGTVFPSYVSFRAVQELPAGLIVVVIALVPLFALPMALLMGFEKFNWMRFVGIGFGAIAVGLLVGPQASLPDASKVGFVFLAMLAPLAYAAEGIFLAWVGNKKLDPVQILYGANLIGLILVIPLAFGSQQYFNPVRVWGAAEWAILWTTVANWFAYLGYIWLVGKAGPIFAAQVSYLVTGFGIVWAMVVLGESYSAYIWAAIGLMMVGLFLVQPNKSK